MISHKCRVFKNPDGSISIVHPNEKYRNRGEPDVEFYSRVFNKAMSSDPALDGLPSEDIDSSDLPPDRSKRHKRRLNPANKVVVDPSVPDPPHPRQKLLDGIESATTVAQLKTFLLESITGKP